MIRTLRRKFILVNMLLVSLVLLMVFGVFMASSAQRLKDQSLLAMRAALMWGEEGSPLRPEIAFPLDGSRRPSSGQGAQRSLLPVFTVTVEDGVVTAINDGDQVDVSPEVAQQAAQAALEDGRRDGTVSSLRYLREDAEGGARTGSPESPLPTGPGSGKIFWPCCGRACWWGCWGWPVSSSSPCSSPPWPYAPPSGPGSSRSSS